MEPFEMEKTLTEMIQLPYSFLRINLPAISLPRLDTHISTLFARLDILQDQDLVNMVIALLLSTSTFHPDALCGELRMFLGSQTRVVLLSSSHRSPLCCSYGSISCVKSFARSENMYL